MGPPTTEVLKTTVSPKQCRRYIEQACIAEDLKDSKDTLRVIMAEWFLGCTEPLKVRISEICADMVNEVSRRSGKRVGFGAAGALELLGVFICIYEKWDAPRYRQGHPID